ncbi:MAG: ATP synthase F1 subunit gamma [Candidatus Doudnabacteria bacterium]|nr:ATP synthase F1 subunit gamma [Candidatus Doudnabacteria bacterium]
MPGIKELKTRIKSIGSTRKITRAMQMVSAAKMRKTQNMVLQSRSYAELAWELIENIANTGNFANPLVKTYPEAKKVGVLLLTTNKGLVGSLNLNLQNKIKETLNTDLLAEIITYGKKGHQMAVRLNKNISADFTKLEKTVSVEDVYPIAEFIKQLYISGEYQKILIIYNQFISTISQEARIKQLLPFKQEFKQTLASEEFGPKAGETEYLFEPEPDTVLNHLLPRIIESQIYETILESNASEQSARMVMMKNATEAAGDLINDLTLTFNQLRQGKITTELAEITAGRIALE